MNEGKSKKPFKVGEYESTKHGESCGAQEVISFGFGMVLSLDNHTS